MSKKIDKQPNLETSLEEITGLIEKMEQGDLSLEQSLDSFERGITLIKHAQKILQDAEQKVRILVQDSGEDKLVDFESNDK